MDFQKILPLIIKRFDETHVRYALIGGFALGALGVMRSTMDVDFLINKKDQAKADAVMKELGYCCAYKSENAAQYVSDLKIFGEVDLLFGYRATSLRMLKRAKVIPIFDGASQLKVVIPEDLIGLKIQALTNNPDRTSREYADIESLLDLYRGKIDWGVLKQYFVMFDKEDKYNEYEQKYKKKNAKS